MPKYSIPTEYMPCLYVIFWIVVYTSGRQFASYKDFIYFDIPKWLRKVFFIIDIKEEKVSLTAVISQSTTIITILIYILGCVGINLLNCIECIIPTFSAFHGDFSTQFLFWFGFYAFCINGVGLAIYVSVCHCVL